MFPLHFRIKERTTKPERTISVDIIVTAMWGCSSKPTQHLWQRAWLWASHRPTGLSLGAFHPLVLVTAEVASVFLANQVYSWYAWRKELQKGLDPIGVSPAQSEKNKICHCWLPWASLWGTHRRTQFFLKTGNCSYFNSMWIFQGSLASWEITGCCSVENSVGSRPSCHHWTRSRTWALGDSSLFQPLGVTLTSAFRDARSYVSAS